MWSGNQWTAYRSYSDIRGYPTSGSRGAERNLEYCQSYKGGRVLGSISRQPRESESWPQQHMTTQDKL